MSKERSAQDLKILQLAACPCTSSGIITFTSIVAHHPFINPHLYVVSNVVPKQWIIFAWKKKKEKKQQGFSNTIHVSHTCTQVPLTMIPSLQSPIDGGTRPQVFSVNSWHNYTDNWIHCGREIRYVNVHQSSRFVIQWFWCKKRIPIGCCCRGPVSMHCCIDCTFPTFTFANACCCCRPSDWINL